MEFVKARKIGDDSNILIAVSQIKIIHRADRNGERSEVIEDQEGNMYEAGWDDEYVYHTVRGSIVHI